MGGDKGFQAQYLCMLLGEVVGRKASPLRQAPTTMTSNRPFTVVLQSGQQNSQSRGLGYCPLRARLSLVIANDRRYDPIRAAPDRGSNALQLIERIAQTSIGAKPVTTGWGRASNRTPNSMEENHATLKILNRLSPVPYLRHSMSEFLDISIIVNYIGVRENLCLNCAMCVNTIPVFLPWRT